MEFHNITDFRALAEKCFYRAQLTDDRRAKFRWLVLAEGWLLLSENMEQQVTGEPPSMPQPYTRH